MIQVQNTDIHNSHVTFDLTVNGLRMRATVNFPHPDFAEPFLTIDYSLGAQTCGIMREIVKNESDIIEAVKVQTKADFVELKGGVMIDFNPENEPEHPLTTEERNDIEDNLADMEYNERGIE